MKKRFIRFFAVIVSVCSALALAMSLSACGNKDNYIKVSLKTPEKLPEEIVSVELWANMTDGDGVQHYLETAEEGKNFIWIGVRCKLGYEPDLTAVTNTFTVKLDYNRADVYLDENNTVGVYSCPIDTSKFSGEEVISVTGGVRDAYYPMSLSTNANGDTVLGNYEKFSVTIDGKSFTFADFVWTDNPKKAIVPHGKPFTVTVKIDGKTFTKDDGSYICSPVWSDYEQVYYEGDELFKISGDTISYKLIMRGTGTIFIDLPILNNLYE